MKASAWRRASRSSAGGYNCVEARLTGHGPELRDSKLGDRSPVLHMTRTDFAAFLRLVT
ncbi:uncharacterized protein DUF397 [Stackebrandtia albiflava]|uniref:Uncharacterized protein DUF397 n=1 Tax=Stackebrandtia albiflava TaxID=406432 RepID=A0A562V9U5_9ACTN|nr:DUF397 domain-containing protein [Stackebrandtia albiflava]TWJ14656.1 uncharacterized protein DUF397 [Stackebrandtia albiflava]